VRIIIVIIIITIMICSKWRECCVCLMQVVWAGCWWAVSAAGVSGAWGGDWDESETTQGADCRSQGRAKSPPVCLTSALWVRRAVYILPARHLPCHLSTYETSHTLEMYRLSVGR